MRCRQLGKCIHGTNTWGLIRNSKSSPNFHLHLPTNRNPQLVPKLQKKSILNKNLVGFGVPPSGMPRDMASSAPSGAPEAGSGAPSLPSRASRELNLQRMGGKEWREIYGGEKCRQKRRAFLIATSQHTSFSQKGSSGPASHRFARIFAIVRPQNPHQQVSES